jgi:transcriptional regulator with XRE-family HTH domain
MLTRTQLLRETERRMERLTLRLADDIRRLRLDAGVSIRAVAAITSLHPSFVARVEAGEVRPSTETLTRIGLALGAELGIRYFTGDGPRLHDRFQAPMIEAVLRQLDRRWLARVEVPIQGSARGVVDLVLDERLGSSTVVGEAQSEFRRLEEQIRWFAEKADAIQQRLAREGKPPRDVSRLLIVRSTVATREVARRYAATLSAAYPARTTDIVDALTGNAPWPGSGIVWVRVEDGRAELLRYPPRNVPIGR